MEICVVGSGYVGLVTGACFAEMGHTVYCVDVDHDKISNLKKGILPIYEPGLDEIVVSNHKSGRLVFTTDLDDAVGKAKVFFIAVGTPPGQDGSADLQYVLAVAKEIGSKITNYAVIVDKSTVPVGTAEKVSLVIKSELTARDLPELNFDVVSNPEFLKEGAAVNDFMSPDRIVIGSDSARARDVMNELYAPFTRNHPRTVNMGVRDAEMTKYAANAMLATKISFMNEIANICERLGADVENVRLGIGSDQRIGFHFIYPGAGYGGSCFPKDVKALLHMAGEVGFNAELLKAVEERNKHQKRRIFEKLTEHFGENGLNGKTIAIWGLAFKPGTDDMREAPSLMLVDQLLKAGASVQLYDPVAMKAAGREFDPQLIDQGKIVFCQDQYAAATDADALVLLTEWKIFRNPDFLFLKSRLKSANIFDGRNQYDPAALKVAGFNYYGIGR